VRQAEHAMPRIPLAYHNLRHNLVRSLVAIVGVTFAVVLMFMQLGFLEAVKASATVFYDALDFDICIHSRDYDYFSDPRTFPRTRLTMARETPGVAAAAGLWVGMFGWRSPTSGAARAVLVLGLPPEEPVYREPAMQSLVRQMLARPQAMLVDSQTRRDYGPRKGTQFSPADVGQTIEINGRQMQIAGIYTQGTGLSAGGAALMSERDFRRVMPQFPRGGVSLGLVRVERGQDVQQVARELRRRLPDDVEVETRAEVLASDVHHWVRETNYGLIFQSGVLVAFVVGTAIVYQVLASEVSSLIREYATLKAMGYNNAFLASVMVQQALLVALLAFVVGAVLAEGLYAITRAGARIPIFMTPGNLLLVLVLTVILCIASGLAAIRKAFHADPADLF
jgi:putative ABC transport system permease protein